MIQTLQLEAHALGALFYYGLEHNAGKALLQAINEGTITDLLPNLPLADWQTALAVPNLQTAWQTSFYGPGYLPAPPWGSVYLDPERVVFGVSLIELRSFLSNLGLQLTSAMNEPEDHFGLLLLLAAQLATEQEGVNKVPDSLRQLLTLHLLPWSKRYLNCLAESAEHPFIKLLAEYTQLRLATWQKDLNLKITAKKLYWPAS